MKTIVVIGATGDVGRGITAALLDAGHRILGVGRDTNRLAALAAEIDRPGLFLPISGSLDSDETAAALLAVVESKAGLIDGVIVSINGPRHLPGLLALSTERFAALVAMDVTTHFTAARAFMPAVRAGGSYLGIGGGSADFILEGGAHMSIAQAGLRMMYRGLQHEVRDWPLHVNLLTIASVVNASSNRDNADPLWVTDAEIGARVSAMIGDPTAYPEPIWRISRRGPDGVPGFIADAPTRVQGLTR